jgi:hypothetical protein
MKLRRLFREKKSSGLSPRFDELQHQFLQTLQNCGRRGNAELHRFLQMAMGSANELEYHLLLSKDLGYLKPENHQRMQPQVEEVKRMLASLIRKVDSERV